MAEHVADLQPLEIGVCVGLQGPAVTGKEPEVIELVAGHGRYRVIAPGDGDGVEVLYPEAKAPLLSVYGLRAEAVRRIEPEEVYLLHPRLFAGDGGVVLVRREARPAAGAVERLADDQPGRRLPPAEYVDDLPLPDVPAHRLLADTVGRDHDGPRFFF